MTATSDARVREIANRVATVLTAADADNAIVTMLHIVEEDVPWLLATAEARTALASLLEAIRPVIEQTAAYRSAWELDHGADGAGLYERVVEASDRAAAVLGVNPPRRA